MSQAVKERGSEGIIISSSSAPHTPLLPAPLPLTDSAFWQLLYCGSGYSNYNTAFQCNILQNPKTSFPQ